MEEQNKFPSTWLLVLAVLALIVLLTDGTYILFHHIELQRGVVERGTGICNMFGGGCDDVLLSDYSKFAGLSSGALGVAYGITTSFLLWSLLAGWGPRQAIGMCLVLFTGAGLAGSLMFLKFLYIDLKGNCALCLVYHGANLMAALTCWGVAAVWVPLTKQTKVGSDVAGVTNRHLVPGVGMPAVMGLLVLLGYFAWEKNFEYNYLNNQISTLMTEEERQFLLFDRSPEQFVPDDPNVPYLGPLDAPHVLVAFKDFECPPCKENAKVLEKLHKDYPTQVRIVFRHFPLSVDCMPELQKANMNLHPQACAAAEAAEAARMQGKFWEFHDLMYSRQQEIDSRPFLLWAEELGLDVKQFEQDMNSSVVREAIRRDIELGERLKVDSTPTLFVDGKEVTFSNNEKVWNKLTEKLFGTASAKVDSATGTAGS